MQFSRSRPWPANSNTLARRRRLLIERYERRELLAADFEPIKVLNTNTQSSSPNSFTQVGSQLFFRATTEVGAELWKTDGTATGTVMVKDILPGTAGSNPGNLTAVGGLLYFTANSPASGYELWKSDGTAAGTVMVKDIQAGTGSGAPAFLCNVNGTLYFLADDGSTGNELWKSDGTNGGTALVKDIRAGGSSNPFYLTNLGGTLIFVANDGTNGNELWRSDGTSGGTTLVSQIRAGAFSSYPRYLTVAGGVVYFTADDGINGRELWKSGGTAGSTFLEKNIGAGASSGYERNLVNINNTLYFNAADGAGSEFWRSDGAGTVMVKDINPTGSSGPYQFTNVSGTIYFSAFEPGTGRELWKSNGTAAGTVLVKDVRPGSSSSYPSNFANLLGSLVFAATDSSGTALWRSDGTSVGTTLITHGSPASLSISNMQSFAGAVFFAGNETVHGNELWKSDGTQLGTALLKDINSNYTSINATKLGEANGKVFFTATTPTLGSELWVTDGTAANTQLVMDINPGKYSSYPSSPALVGNILYFSANDGTTGSELWRSDGTLAGTYRLKDIATGIANSSPFALTEVNGFLFFDATDSINGSELWVTDGTTTGTRLVSDIVPGSASSLPTALTNVNGALLFTATTASGVELWRSDGSASNTVLVKDIRPASGSYPNSLTAFNGKLYFAANDGISGTELWVSDGTASGTTLLTDIFPGASSSSPSLFTTNGNQLFFYASDSSGNELWKTDGTPLGTQRVKDIAPTGSSYPRYLTNVNGVIYFVADNQVNGRELWRSDGTSTGTFLVKDINPGALGATIYGMTNLNGQLVFRAIDGNAARNWMSDGTTSGTVPLISSNGPAAIVNSFSSLNGKLLAFGSDVLQMTQNVKVDLSTSTSDRSIVIRKANNGIEVFDQTNLVQLAFLSSLAVANVQQLTIIGSDTANESITVDYQSGGFFRLPGGLSINAGSSSGDILSIVGTLAQQLSWQSQSGLQAATFSVQQPSTTSTGSIDGFEAINVMGFVSASVNGLLQAGPPNLFFSIPGPLNLGQTTQLSGGSLNISSLVALGSGEVLTGSGTVQGRFNAELGSMILPTGNMSIGSGTSTSGFNTRGDLIVDQFSVSLLDANEAVLGTQTSLGNVTTPGSLNSANGLLVDFGNNVNGFGSINTPNLVSKPFTMNGSIVGTSAVNPITLTGYVKGVGSLTNVSIAGTYSPGFSPAAVTVGTVNYAPTSTTVIELGGALPGSGYDQINHVGTASLGGTLNVQLINSYVPVVGDSFTIMTATGGFTGSFATQVLPAAPLGAGWNLTINSTTMRLQLVDLANVQATQLGDGTPQHSRIDKLVVTFQGPVDIDAGAFALLRRGVGGGQVTNSFTTSLDGSGNTVATILFSGAFTRASGALVDGYYQLNIDNSKVRRAGTNLALDGDSNGLAGGDFVRGTSATDNFFAFYGDTNGDGLVGVAEFGQFRSSFGKLPTDPGYNLLFDYDGGGVGVADFGQFRSRFGRALPFE